MVCIKKMYSKVPPPTGPGLHIEGTHGASYIEKAKEANTSSSQPANISQEQWERFQKLRSRRAELCGKSKTRRVNALRKKTLDQVNKDLTKSDKLVLLEEGVTLPAVKRRKIAEKDVKATIAGVPRLSGESSSEWQEVRKYLDPNPQLKSQDSSARKSGLEKALDEAVTKGEFERAADISNNMATRELASKISTAFDCVEYVKEQKLEKEKKRRKPAKLKWSFEQKNRWETKGNM